MKEEIKQALIEEMQKHPYGTSGEYSFENLFKFYTTLAIKDIKDLNYHNLDFYNFIMKQEHLLDLKDKEADFGAFKSILYSTIKPFIQFTTRGFFKSYHKDQVKYKDVIQRLIAKKSDSSVLDVGAGKVPYSSFLLAKDGVDVTALDKFAMSDESIANLGVKPRDELFTPYTDISGYDLIAGKRPCGAIESIVENCNSKGIPYFVELCACEAPGSKIATWYEVLKSHDPDVQFNRNGTIAYHLEMKNDEVDEIIGDGFANPDLGAYYGLNR